MDFTYSAYLKLDKILNAQSLESPDEHDETLFIIIHQVYELWFKQLIHEGRFLAASLKSADHSLSIHTLNRMLKVMKTLVSQVDILETMTPLSFTSFRSYLKSSSGFQSIQFRLFEIMLGKRSPELIAKLPAAEVEQWELNTHCSQPPLYDCLLVGIQKSGFHIPEEVLSRDFSETYEGNEEVRNVILEIYRKKGELARILENFVDLDEGIQEWRYRHVKMVERTIGHMPGTGGSAGVEYLKNTLFQPFFPDLWKVRGRF